MGGIAAILNEMSEAEMKVMAQPFEQPEILACQRKVKDWDVWICHLDRRQTDMLQQKMAAMAILQANQPDKTSRRTCVA